MEYILLLILFSAIGLFGIAIVLSWGEKLQKHNLKVSRRAVKEYGDLWFYGWMARFNVRGYKSKYYLLYVRALGVYFVLLSIMCMALITYSFFFKNQ